MSSRDDFQERSTRVGVAFRQECQRLLESIGFVLIDVGRRLEEFGIIVELIYRNRHGLDFFFEAAGTDEEEPASGRPGLERTDTVKKIIANAFLTKKATNRPSIVLTSHTPRPDSSSGKMLNMSGRDVIFDVINIYETGNEQLERYYNMTEGSFQQLVRENIRLLF